VCYVWILVSLFRGAVKELRKTDGLFLKAFTLGVIMIFVEVTFESLAEPVFSTPPQYFFVFASLGIAHSIGSRGEK